MKRRLVLLLLLLLLEYDTYLINWIRADFAPQMQINKTTARTLSDSMKAHPYSYRTEHVREHDVHRAIAHTVHSNNIILPTGAKRISLTMYV
jgi:hypothetical protein